MPSGSVVSKKIFNLTFQRADQKTCVIRAKFFKGRSSFLVSQLNGRVSIYNYDRSSVQLMGILNSEIWPSTAEERRLAAREIKQQNALKHRLSLKLSNKGNHLVPDDEKLAVDAQKQHPQTTKAISTTKRINKARIITVASKPTMT